jgi:hypothetical protein
MMNKTIERRAGESYREKSSLNYALWTVQGLLAAVFLLAGGMKWIVPIAEMTKQTALPGWFIRFIGAAELTGAFGLILPGLLRIRVGLTPLAAACLEVIIIGATTITIMSQGLVPAVLPFVTGIGLAFVIYGRWGRDRKNFNSSVDPVGVRST